MDLFLLRARAGVGAALAFVALPLPAATAWSCALSRDLVRLVCEADADAAPQPPTPQVAGTRFPLDPRRRWVVDLWSPPNEAEAVRQLARATVCYRSPGCAVRVDLGALDGHGDAKPQAQR